MMSSYKNFDNSPAFEQVNKFGLLRIKYAQRFDNAVNKINKYSSLKKTLEKSQLLFEPPLVPEFEEERVPSLVNINYVDNRSYADVAKTPLVFKEIDKPIHSIPVIRSNIKLYNYYIRQINYQTFKKYKALKNLKKLNNIENNYLNKVYSTNCELEVHNEIEYDKNLDDFPNYVRKLNISIKSNKVKSNSASFNHSVLGTYIQKPSAIRDLSLSLLLRAKIKSFRYKVSKIKQVSLSTRFKDNCNVVTCNYANPQMDAHGDTDTINLDKLGTTTLMTQREESQAISEPVILDKWKTLTTTDNITVISTPVERWYRYATATWSTSGIDISKINLPSDLFSKMQDSYFYIPFRNHRYWCGDLHFKFILNSNKFQIGSLQISYLYACSLEDKCEDNRNNVYSLSQTNHCLLNAGSSNEGQLIIPFKCFNPFISTDKSLKYDYATIFLKPLNKLLATSTTSNQAHVSIFVAVQNAHFSGSLDATLVNPSMFHILRAVCKTVEFGLDQIAPDSNRDLPPDPTPATPITIQNVSSMAHGTNNFSPINILRLSATGQTPHPNLVHDQLDIKTICRVFGLVQILEWKSSLSSGSWLESIDAAPIIEYNKYFKTTYIDDQSTYKLYALPPVSVISSLFSYWRGSLELRLDIIASQFHTGSLLIAYLPGIYEQQTIDKARSSNYVICDIQEQQSFTIQIPFISNAVVWPRMHSSSSSLSVIQPPGTIQIFILNSLIPMDSVYNSVFINVYIRGGQDFEVLVPCQPNIATPYNLRHVVDPINRYYPSTNLSGHVDYNYVLVSDDSVKYTFIALTPLDSVNRAQIIPYLKLRDATDLPRTDLVIVENIGYKYDFYLIHDRGVNMSYDEKGDGNYVTKLVKYYVCYNEQDRVGDRFTTIFPVSGPKNAEAYVNSSQGWADVSKYFLKANPNFLGGNLPDIYGGNAKDPFFFTKVTIKKKILCEEESDWSICSDQMREERINSEVPITMTRNLESTQHGLLLFGESFNDIKDYLRRYHYYTSYVLKASDKYFKVGAVIPLMPQGLRTEVYIADKLVNSIVNRCKEGPLSLISSGYRFYRGGLRVRIVFNNLATFTTVWVQHRHDAHLEQTNAFPSTVFDFNIDDYFNHSYATYIQNLMHNNIISLEIPWYNKNLLCHSFYPNLETTRIINNDPISSFTLGNLVIGTHNVLDKDIYFDVFVSVADDFHFNTFQGFPVMMTLNQIKDNVTADPQMGLFNIISKGKETVEQSNKLVDKGNDFLDKAEDILKQLPTLIADSFKSTTSSIKVILFDCFSQLVHCIINPTISTLAWALSAILLKLGLVVDSSLGIINRIFLKIVAYFSNAPDVEVAVEVRPEQPESSTALPQSDAELGELCSSLASILWCGLVAALGVSFKKCEQIGDYAQELVKGLTKGSISGNVIFRFVKNNFKFLELCYKYIVRKTHNAYNRYLTLEIESEDLIEWLKVSEQLLNPINYSLIQNNLKWRETLYASTRYGHLYFCQQLMGKKPSVDNYIRKVYSDLISLRDSMIDEKLFPSLRQEAFGIWIDGPPGIGKSSMVNDMAHDLLKSINYRGNKSLIFNLNPTDKFWSDCNHQPCMLIDDAFAVTSPEAVAYQLWAYFAVMSPVPLVPPMAELEKKNSHYNPEIFFTCSNNAFPVLPALSEPSALYRRRHILIKASLIKPEFKDYPFGFTPEEVTSLKHLKFLIADDPRDPETTYTDIGSYQNLIKFSIIQFEKFKIRSQRSYEHRKKIQFAFFDDESNKIDLGGIKITDWLDNYDKQRINLFESIPTEFGTIRSEKKWYQELNEVGICQIVKSFFNKQDINIDDKDFPPLQLDLKLNSVVKVQMAIEDMIADSTYCKEQMNLVEEIKNELRTEIKENPELVQLCGQMLEEVPTHNSLLMLEYNKIYSSNLSLLLSCSKLTNSQINEKDVKDSSLWISLNDDLNNYIKYNLIDDKSKNMCLHRFLSKDSKLIKIKVKGFDLYYWLCPIKRKYDSITSSSLKDSHTHFPLGDTPCSSPHCIVIHSKLKWEELVLKWYKAKFFSFNEDMYNSPVPVISNVLSRESMVIKYISKTIFFLKKTIKIAVFDWFYKTFHWFGEFFLNFSSFLVGLSCCVNIATWSWIKHKNKNSISPQLIASGDTHTKSANNAREIIFGKFARAQLGDGNLLNVIEDRIRRNTVYISFIDQNLNKKAMMKCLIIKGRVMLVLRHYIEYLESNVSDSSTVQVVWEHGFLPFDFKLHKIDWCSNSNFGLLELGANFSARKSLIPFISRKKIIQSATTSDCSILDYSIDRLKVYQENNISIVKNLVIAPTSYSKKLIIPSSFKYKKNYEGMCGSLLLADFKQCPIVGIHVAGYGGSGYAEPICQELFLDYFNNVRINEIDWAELDVEFREFGEHKLQLTGIHTYLGKMPDNMVRSESGESSIIKSTIHGVFPVSSEPGPLHSKDPRINGQFSPLLEGCEKHCNVTKDFNRLDLIKAYNCLSSLICHKVKPIRCDVHPLSEVDAVNGLELDGYEGMVMNTSEGFPFSRFRPKEHSNKKWLFEFDSNNKVIKINKILREFLDEKKKLRENNIVPVTVFDDCLKDARLPKEKVLIPGKVRVFSISPVDFTIQFRQYYLDFMASYKQARIEAEHAIGINVHGSEWTRLANSVKGECIITGDYSGFGPTLNQEVCWLAFQIINDWYAKYNCKRKDNDIRFIMFQELINARHLMLDYFYSVSCGLPSGSPATVILNSLVNSLYIRCAWLDIMRNTETNSLLDFRKLCKLITYGDDLIMRVDIKIIDKFNNNTISDFFFKHNIKFTDAAKTGLNVAPFVTLENATFLKHSFNNHPTKEGYYLAKLDDNSIYECANWIRKNKLYTNDKLMTYENAVQGSMLAYGHGPVFYNNYVDIIRKEWSRKYCEEFIVRSWDELDYLFSNDKLKLQW